VYKLPADRLYVTVFEGDVNEKLNFDNDSYNEWKKWINEDRILKGNKKDNFWEMGDTGPCGPCSEIHIDLRSESDRKQIDGKTLVNESHPQVVEIWNNVFMEFNRKADGSLQKLPAQHVDTGMGFERLCMALQGKQSNYDTDIFQPLIQYISKHCKIPYGQAERTDIAMRVMSDHIRAISFAIADGQLPSNNKAGYVIRRILRRAVRYQYAVLNIHEPFMHKLVAILAQQFDGVFSELKTQQEFVMRVVLEEETSFLRTLETGIKRFELYKDQNISGAFAFELYDTFGFPIDLTQLMAREKNMTVDMQGFNVCLEEQKNRSRAAAMVDTDDWVELLPIEKSVFIGYDFLAADVRIARYRKVKTKQTEQFHLVFDQTPFYAESGGQVGDTGYIETPNQRIEILDTQKENNLIIHIVDALPEQSDKIFKAQVNAARRALVNNNHSATHLMHAALRKILGNHVAQKGSLVNDEATRFDFSHFAKVTDTELKAIEDMVNEKIRNNIPLTEERAVPIAEATTRGAMALFGEKYGDTVRVITFDKNYSVELCGGTHVPATGHIGLFKIISESSVAAGVRRVEAITADAAVQYYKQQEQTLNQISDLLKNPKDTLKGLQQLLDENSKLKQEVAEATAHKVADLKNSLSAKAINVGDIKLIAETIDLSNADAIKQLSFEMRNTIPNLFLLLGAVVDGKPHLSLVINDALVASKNLNATAIIRVLAKEIQGGGGGQPFYATAGGKNIAGLQSAIAKAKTLIGN
jgi:alanyl-tRNA synthetase